MKNSEQQQTENQLIRTIINGNRECYRKIVDRYSPMVFHVVRRFEHDDEEIKELAQQIFVKAYEKLESFNGKSKFSSWLYSLTINHCRDVVKNVRRNNQRFSEVDDEYLEITMSDPDKTPYQDLEIQEWETLLKQSLQNLNGEYSEPFLLKYRDGMSYEVMSEKLGVGVSALKVRVHRARKELKRLMDK